MVPAAARRILLSRLSESPTDWRRWAPARLRLWLRLPLWRWLRFRLCNLLGLTRQYIVCSRRHGHLPAACC